MLRILILLTLSVALEGCFQAQLNGGIANAEITVASLAEPGKTLHHTRSHGPLSMVEWKGKAEWGTYNTFQKAAWMGVFNLPEALLEKDDLYLVTASGGNNRDSDANMQLDAGSVPIRGSWHSIVPGSQVGDYRNKVSLLTEACYQWLLFEHGDKLSDTGHVLALLDDIATTVVEDINGDGKVNYSDLLAWNIYIDIPRYKGDPVMLEQLSVMITLDFPEENRQRVSREIMLALPPAELAEPGLLEYLWSRLSGNWQ